MNQAAASLLVPMRADFDAALGRVRALPSGPSASRAEEALLTVVVRVDASPSFSSLRTALLDPSLTGGLLGDEPYAVALTNRRDVAAPTFDDFVGAGATEVVRARGGERFTRTASALCSKFERLSGTEEARAETRWFGGGAFAPDDGGDTRWAAFGDALFVLPRVGLLRARGGLHFVATARATEGDVAKTLGLAAAVLEAARRSPTISVTPEHHRVLECHDSADAAHFGSVVAHVRAAIRRGQVKKVVAARRVTLVLEDAPAPAAVLQRLGDEHPEATRFLLRVGKRSFVGATPERLLSLDGLTISTEAVAGTAPEALGAELRESEKDLAEHRHVVDALAATLTGLGARLPELPAPELKSHGQLVHLTTPIEATLPAPRHVLDLVEQLHPTPAVGGVPRAAALALIAREEQEARGWYAAPLGWVDERGNGEFVVALRSALFDENEVHLYAGAGIVDASDASREFDETELKLRTIRSALGLSNEYPPNEYPPNEGPSSESLSSEGASRRVQVP